ncbi:unnamed protein product [Prunus armeniaca]
MEVIFHRGSMFRDMIIKKYNTTTGTKERESQASASIPQFIKVKVETETDVGELGNQLVEVDVGLDDDGDDEAYEFEDDKADNEAPEFEDDDSGEEAAEENSEPDIELIDFEFEQSDEEVFKRVLEEDDNLFDKHVVDEENEEYNEEPGEVNSEDYNTEELVSLNEEYEDEGVRNRRLIRKAPRFKQFIREYDLLKPTFHLGMEFPNMDQCREAIKYYAVSSARPLKWVRNDSYRLFKKFDEELKDNPKMKVTYLIKTVRKHYDIDVTGAQVYKAKSFAKVKIQGSTKEQYGKLWDYCEELKRINPGSSHPRQILSAVKVDENNGMYLIAFAIVEVENTETWSWFFDIFFQDVGIQNDNGCVFITNKQKGLGNVIHALMPNAEHMHCVRHLHNNFKLACHTGLALKQRLWAAARATTLAVFHVEMEQMLDQSEAAYKWLEERPTAHWSISHFTIVLKKWELSGIPCAYALAIITKSEHRPPDFVHTLYKRAPIIKPIVYHIQPGRPKLSRNKEPDEIPRGANVDKEGQPKGAIARGGRRGSGVVMERSAKGRGAATSN